MELGLPEIKVVADASSLAERAADESVRLAGEALRGGGRLTVALAGGSTPQRMYSNLVAERLAHVLQGTFQTDILSAQAVKPVNGVVHWLVDQTAAAKLFPNYHP